MGYALSDLAAKQGSPPLDLQFCEYLNISVCPASQSDSVRRLWEGEEVCVPRPFGFGAGQLGCNRGGCLQCLHVDRYLSRFTTHTQCTHTCTHTQCTHTHMHPHTYAPTHNAHTHMHAHAHLSLCPPRTPASSTSLSTVPTVSCTPETLPSLSTLRHSLCTMEMVTSSHPRLVYI